MLFKDLSIKEKALNTINEYINMIRVSDLTDEQVNQIKENYNNALKKLEENKERFCMLSAIRNYAFQLETKDNLTHDEEEIMLDVGHTEDAMNDFIFTNF